MDTLLEQHYVIFDSIMVVFLEMMELNIYFTSREDGLPKFRIQKRFEFACWRTSIRAVRKTVSIWKNRKYTWKQKRLSQTFQHFNHFQLIQTKFRLQAPRTRVTQNEKTNKDVKCTEELREEINKWHDRLNTDKMTDEHDKVYYLDELGCIYYLGEYKLARECFWRAFKMAFENKYRLMPSIIHLALREIQSAIEDQNEDPLKIANLSYIFMHSVCLFKETDRKFEPQELSRSVEQVNRLLQSTSLHSADALWFSLYIQILFFFSFQLVFLYSALHKCQFSIFWQFHFKTQ